MNANQIINMVIRQIMRRFINKGIDAGLNAATRRKAAPGQDPQAERLQQTQGRDAAQRAKQAMRMGKRIGRL